MKKGQNYTITISVDQTPEDVFGAINNVRGWWSEEIEGSTSHSGDEWAFHFRDVHRCKMKITELVPGKKVVWLVLDNHFNFTRDNSEWTGTKIIFEILKAGKKTQVHFTHHGLLPDCECFDVCSDVWEVYIMGSLKRLITTGKGTPNKKEVDAGKTVSALAKSA
jgi:Activator of Hsp90 ATPase homolog 1-like protein